MKTKLLYLLFALLIIGCTKNNDLPADPAKGVTYVRKIESVKITNLSTDTTWDSLPPLEGSFSTPHKVVFDNPFKSAYDSLYLNIARPDSLPFDLQFDQNVILPSITFGKYGLESLILQNDSIEITSYKTRQAFITHVRAASSSLYTFSNVSNYIFKRLYKRIYFTSDIKLNVKDSKGNSITLTGRLKGSKVGTPYTEMNVY